MGQWDNDELNDIFDRSSGKCHLCHKKLAWRNHGVVGARGAWHVDHSRAKAQGGTDFLRNLKPACISCNCTKRDGTNRSVRSRYGKIRAPLSTKRRREATVWNAVGGGSLGWLVGRALLGPGPALLVGILGAALGARSDPDNRN